MHNNLPNLFVFIDQYDKNLFKNNNINIGIIYRNYKETKKESELIKIAKACKRNRFLLFVSNDIKLAMKFRADGIYIPSFNKTKKFSNYEKRNLIIIGSAHNQQQINEKILQNCKAIFLSPVFYVKKSASYLGVYKFNFLSRSNKIGMFALGGINENNLRKLKLLHIKGIAGISMFKKKTGLKKGRFL
tara:strand:+ start:1893 stop:2456 length:564 start_codon:yes stop_codon:yes gene_type:complete